MRFTTGHSSGIRDILHEETSKLRAEFDRARLEFGIRDEVLEEPAVTFDGSDASMDSRSSSSSEIFRHGILKPQYSSSSAQHSYPLNDLRGRADTSAPLESFCWPDLYQTLGDMAEPPGRMRDMPSTARQPSERRPARHEEEAARLHSAHFEPSRQPAVGYSVMSPRDRYESAAVLYKESQNLMKYLATISSAAARLQHAVVRQQSESVMYQDEDDCPSPAACRCRNKLGLEPVSQPSPRLELLWSEEVLFPSPTAHRAQPKHFETVLPPQSRSVGTQVSAQAAPCSRPPARNADDHHSRRRIEARTKTVRVKDVAVETEPLAEPDEPEAHLSAPRRQVHRQSADTSCQTDRICQTEPKEMSARCRLGSGIAESSKHKQHEESNPVQHRKLAKSQETHASARSKKMKRILIRRLNEINNSITACINSFDGMSNTTSLEDMQNLEVKIESLQSEYSQVCQVLEELGVDVNREQSGGYDSDSDN
ncbi:hypothetical protein GUITHDRAFT_135222 [Guillardia theta CCMP2712]|uniref:Uncharacterized protein n=1 Tax=Guillardia theta (strain CCMP2712) TaxID=905079 RepID=L1JPS3_GUITC|nr:hypothetical protein GUITHDRAFT_135222 [Guillardia theta CCMP2712]EKX50591.1 hypothetical protein GUITHDRAFT_135222 [Guillardia theta CCMP2712]|mmetsp:Transcript_51774/g.161103  ORF Transcript_51774/g.161103 Transcript_51774/m.161103 type:complete len:482 (-) Transcript_51774:41-1486(-)|eukprot:XP_005837571.1 hypothetical protein GUITHDRAFT_135222 [Guillardia theta CCMP2712]